MLIGFEKKSTEFGIVANVLEGDGSLRPGAKAWIGFATGGSWPRRAKFYVMSRSGRMIEKWAPTMRFHNFRAAWVPPTHADFVFHPRGGRPEMEALAKELEKIAEEERAAHQNRKD